ncbi:MAG: lipopolysaccharide heptosyltransferase I [Pseudomonadales bacterium]
MKVLIVKMSSLGDIVHTLPALTDAVEYDPTIRFDWVVEEAFTDIPAMHPAVENVLPIAMRRWRRHWSGALGALKEFREFRGRLRASKYDLVIDAQGLLKSAFVTRMCLGETAGLDRVSARESLASLVYDRPYQIEVGRHAVDRTRELFAAALGYSVPPRPARYGLLLSQKTDESKSIMLLHGTTWPSKQWPQMCWQQLGSLVEDDGFQVILPYGNDHEREQAEAIASALSRAAVLPPSSLGELAAQMSCSSGAVSVDSGLGHLAAALGVPMVALYGPTDPELTGVSGPHQSVLVGDHLPCIPCLKRICKFRRPEDSGRIHPPCFATMTPERVWDSLKFHIAGSNRKLS